jgi:heme/copper-type cytochrome/quinol oxidase subunit 2
MRVIEHRNIIVVDKENLWIGLTKSYTLPVGNFPERSSNISGSFSSCSSLRVWKSEQVRSIMAAVDHDHGIKLDDFEINRTIPKRTTVVVEFTADNAGTFQFRCSSVCRLNHRDMKSDARPTVFPRLQLSCHRVSSTSVRKLYLPLQ